MTQADTTISKEFLNLQSLWVNPIISFKNQKIFFLKKLDQK